MHIQNPNDPALEQIKCVAQWRKCIESGGKLDTASSVTGADTSLYLLKTEENECFRIKLVQKRRKGRKKRLKWEHAGLSERRCSTVVVMHHNQYWSRCRNQTSKLTDDRNSGNADIIFQFATFTLKWKWC